MMLPSEILSKNELTFTALVVWCKKDVNPDFYATGFKLSDISNEDIVVIENLIHRYGFND